jgi:hypothetical protein
MNDDTRSFFEDGVAVAQNGRQPDGQGLGLPPWARPAIPAVLVGALICAVTSSWVLIVPAVGVAAAAVAINGLLEKIRLHQSMGE